MSVLLLQSLFSCPSQTAFNPVELHSLSESDCILYPSRTAFSNCKNSISDDCTRILNEHFAYRIDILQDHEDERVQDLVFQAEQYALYLIAGQLDHQSTAESSLSLELFNLPPVVIPFDLLHKSRIQNRLLREEISYDITPEDAEVEWQKLNTDQRLAAERIMAAVDENNDDEYSIGALFFLDGAGGTGKTMVQNTILKKLRSQKRIALVVASSGIATTLLDGGRTAHSRFKILLDAESTSSCGIQKGTNLAELIKRACIIFWDEVPMQSRFAVKCVSRSLQDLCGNNGAYFGGKVVCFCGDFRQTLPVVPGGTAGVIINACI